MEAPPSPGGFSCCVNDVGNAPAGMGGSGMGSGLQLGLGGTDSDPCCKDSFSPDNQPPQMRFTADSQYRPFPQPGTGELFVEVPIHINGGPKFQFQFDFVYGSKQTSDNEAGKGQGAFIRARVYSPTSGASVTVSRGGYVDRNYVRTHVGIPNTPPFTYTSSDVGATTTLQYDGSKFKEFFPNGMRYEYQAQVSGGSPVNHELIGVFDPTGVPCTYGY